MREILVIAGLQWPPEALNKHRVTVPELGVLVPAQSNWGRIGAPKPKQRDVWEILKVIKLLEICGSRLQKQKELKNLELAATAKFGSRKSYNGTASKE